MRSSRILFTTTLCQDLWISGATIYGEPPGTSHPNTAEHTDTLIQTAIDSLSLMPGLRFLAGDLNFELGSLECFERLDQLGFKDVQKLAELRWASHRNVPVKDRPETTFCSFPLSCNSFSIRLTLFMMCGPITVFWSVILVVTRCLSTPQFGTPRSQLIGLRILTSLSFRVWISLRQIQRMHMPTCGPKLKQLRLSRLGSLLNQSGSPN